MAFASRRCVLLIDDDSLVRTVLSMSLEGHDFQVVEAASGEAALRLMQEGLDPDFVVTDIDLGRGFGGIELAENLEKIRPTLRVVLISGRSIPPPPPLDARHRPFLSKPFPVSSLVELLRD